MKLSTMYAYTMNARVVWISDKIFNLPVLSDLYRIHRFENTAAIGSANCLQYTVKHFHKFLQDELILLPLASTEASEFLLAHEKIKAYLKLKEFINCSYLSALPDVFEGEEDRIEMLALSLVNTETLSQAAKQKHIDLTAQLIRDKKSELKNRFITIVHQLKACENPEQVQKIMHTIVYEGLHVV